jgi:hypothetical protein
MFCDACLYNLHGLDVTRDDRLNLPVVRCPECGKFHAAGAATGAGRVWLHRLARFLIVLWVGFILVAVALAGLSFFIMCAAEFECFIRRDWHAAGPAFRGAYTYTLRPIDASDFGSLAAYLLFRYMIAGLSLFFGWCLGAFLPVFLWHVRNRAWFLLILFLPALLGFCMYEVYLADLGSRVGDGDWVYVLIASLRQFAFQSAGILAGIAFGRPVARVLLRALLTRKLLQYVRFLWEVDGKTPPSLASPAEPLPVPA